MTDWPHCHNCGRFVNPRAKGVSGRLDVPADYWNGPDGETYRCATCTAYLGLIENCHGTRPETAWVNTTE